MNRCRQPKSNKLLHLSIVDISIQFPNLFRINSIKMKSATIVDSVAHQLRVNSGFTGCDRAQPINQVPKVFATFIPVRHAPTAGWCGEGKKKMNDRQNICGRWKHMSRPGCRH
jgi:hypothetical protein